mmetsp:Transcript_52070/g.111459  ORF Transcript_52070/g.111459 Transcript_52070/m.111459 type:complete len:369 (+) Transcript_52070:47-1153(+)
MCFGPHAGRRAMRLGHALWRGVPPPRPGASPAPDFAAAAAALGAGPRLERKPWVLISDFREDLERHFGLATDELLLALSRWLEGAAAAPATAGLAHISGNVYLAPALDLGRGRAPLAPEQVLMASLFAHGEIGLDAFAGTEPPSPEAGDLLREVRTYKRLRWLDVAAASAASPDEPAVSKKQAAPLPHRPRELGEIVRPAKLSAFRRHRLLDEVLAAAKSGAGGDDCSAGRGDCLQHPNYKFREVEGENLAEMQVSLARVAAARAYCRPDDECTGVVAGCALRTHAGTLFAGSSIATRLGPGSVTPLQAALVSVGANGGQAGDVASVVWASESAGDADRAALQQLCTEDESLLRTLVPTATFTLAPSE